MPTNKRVLVVLAAICLLSIIIYTAGYIMHHELPKISVALGDTVDSVEQHSTYPFRKKMVNVSIGKQAFVLTKVPMVLEYRNGLCCKNRDNGKKQV